MQINGKEYGFAYTVGAKCDIDEAMIANGVKEFSQFVAKRGATALTVLLAKILSKAYAEVNGTEALTDEEIRKIPMDVFEQIDSEVFETLTYGKKRSVEAKPSKKEVSTK